MPPWLRKRGCPDIRRNDRDADFWDNETDREDERKRRKRIQMSAVCVCTASLVKTNKSVCHWYALFDWHSTVHLGPERNIQSSRRKIQIQQRCTINLQDEYRAVVCSTTQRHEWGLAFPPLKCWQGSGGRHPSNGAILICTMPKTQHAAPVATRGSLFGQFPGNSVISARPDMNAGRVDSGWTAEGSRGRGLVGKIIWMVAPQLRLSGRGSVSFLFSPWLLFSDPSVLTSQRTDARHAAMKTASGPAGENWAKLATRILQRTHNHITRWHTDSLYCSHLAFQ